MQQINLNIKLVIFRISDGILCIYIPDGHLPTEHISQTIPLAEQVENLFSKTLGTSLSDYYSEQLYTFPNDNNEINIVYYVLLANNNNLSAGEQFWVEITSKTKADHQIISYALQRLQWKIEYTNVIYSLLPKILTLSDLQKTYEIILGKKLDKRNFRKKILSLNFLKPTGKKRTDNARPALTYTFTKRAPQLVKVFS
jgi:8-oxo-dGTP diphosphatase